MFLSMAVLVLLSFGMLRFDVMGEEILIWSPVGNPSLVNYWKSLDLFPNRNLGLGIIVTTKDRQSNLLTIDAFQELIDFETKMFELEVTVDG